MNALPSIKGKINMRVPRAHEELIDSKIGDVFAGRIGLVPANLVVHSNTKGKLELVTQRHYGSNGSIHSYVVSVEPNVSSKRETTISVGDVELRLVKSDIYRFGTEEYNQREATWKMGVGLNEG